MNVFWAEMSTGYETYSKKNGTPYKQKRLRNVIGQLSRKDLFFVEQV